MYDFVNAAADNRHSSHCVLKTKGVNMHRTGWFAGIVVILILAGCAGLVRKEAVPDELTARAVVPGFADVRYRIGIDDEALLEEALDSSEADRGLGRVMDAVEKRFRELRDYTDPARLFGSEAVLAKSAEEAGDFADPQALHSLPLSEYILRTP